MKEREGGTCDFKTSAAAKSRKSKRRSQTFESTPFFGVQRSPFMREALTTSYAPVWSLVRACCAEGAELLPKVTPASERKQSGRVWHHKLMT